METQPSSRRWWWLGAAVIGAVAVALVVWAVGDDGDDPDAAPTTSTTAPGEATDADGGLEDLDDEAAELAQLLAAGRDVTIHAVYRDTGDDEFTLELWRDDGRLRQDTRFESDTTSADSSGFVVDGRSISCSRTDDADWVCSAADAETSPDGFFGSAVALAAGQDVSARDDVVEGREARCFEYPVTEGQGELCVTREGLPVRFDTGDTTLLLVSVDDDVDDDDFEPPAEVAGDGR